MAHGARGTQGGAGPGAAHTRSCPSIFTVTDLHRHRTQPGIAGPVLPVCPPLGGGHRQTSLHDPSGAPVAPCCFLPVLPGTTCRRKYLPWSPQLSVCFWRTLTVSRQGHLGADAPPETGSHVLSPRNAAPGDARNRQERQVLVKN